MLHLHKKNKLLTSFIILFIILTPSYFLTAGPVNLTTNEMHQPLVKAPYSQVSQNSNASILPYTTTVPSNSALSTYSVSNAKINLNSSSNFNNKPAIKSTAKAISDNYNYTLGSVDTFWVENLYNAYNGKDNNGDGKTFAQGDWAEAMYQINAKLLNVTQHAYIFVDQNSKYYNDYVNGLAAQIGQVFETKIYPSDSRLGTPIKIGQYNQNNRIIILIFDFIEGNLHPGYYTTGYFWPLQMHTPSTDNSSIYYYSNYKEIININTIFIHNENNNIQTLAPTLAHEYFHLIHYNYNQNEDLWLEEGMAVFAEYLAGYKSGYISYLQDTQGNGYFLHASDESLTYFAETLEHYGASFLIVLYLYQRFGLGFIKDIVQFPNRSGISAIKYELSVKESSVSFNQLYSDWIITNVINNQASSTYSYVNFTYKVSASQYNLDNALKIVPSQFTNQLLPFWSNQFYTLPKSNLEPYLVNFLPDIPNNISEYQLTVITMNNGHYQFRKIPLVNDQSGSFVVQYENNSQTLEKLLIISSLTGNTSGGNPILDSQMFSTYFSRYNLYLSPFTYNLNYTLENPGNFYPSYGFNIRTATGQRVNNNQISSAKLTIYKWNTNQTVTGVTGNILYNSAKQSWIIDNTNFEKLPLGQYYFTVTITMTNGNTFTAKGLTFLLGAGNLTSNSNSSKNGLSYPGIVILLPLFVMLAMIRRKRKNK